MEVGQICTRLKEFLVVKYCFILFSLKIFYRGGFKRPLIHSLDLSVISQLLSIDTEENGEEILELDLVPENSAV